MAFLLLFAFIAVPIAEIAIFIQAGQLIGLWPTLAAVIATAVIGTALMRHQGLSILGSVNAEIAAGRVPVAQMFDGVCVLIAGVLLLTPGFLTDAVGLALLTPPVRPVLRRWLAWHIKRSAGGVWRVDAGATRARARQGGTIIDGEYQELDEDDIDDGSGFGPGPGRAPAPGPAIDHTDQRKPPAG